MPVLHWKAQAQNLNYVRGEQLHLTYVDAFVGYSSSYQTSCHALLQRLHLLAAVITSFSGRGVEISIVCCRSCQSLQSWAKCWTESWSCLLWLEKGGWESRLWIRAQSFKQQNCYAAKDEPGSYPGDDVGHPPKLSKVFDFTDFHTLTILCAVFKHIIKCILACCVSKLIFN